MSVLVTMHVKVHKDDLASLIDPASDWDGAVWSLSLQIK